MKVSNETYLWHLRLSHDINSNRAHDLVESMGANLGHDIIIKLENNSLINMLVSTQL